MKWLEKVAWGKGGSRGHSGFLCQNWEWGLGVHYDLGGLERRRREFRGGGRVTVCTNYWPDSISLTPDANNFWRVPWEGP